MKRVIAFTLIGLVCFQYSYATEPIPASFYTRLYVSMFTTVGGQIDLTPDSFNFTVSSPSKFESLLSTTNYAAVRSLRIPFNEISDVQRRNTFLIVPNKFLIVRKSGERYLFHSFKRKEIIKQLKHYIN